MPDPRFLVVRLGSLGDIVHTFPAVAGLRETFPSADIVWLTHPRWKLLVESSGLATQIWTTEIRSFQSLRNSIGALRGVSWDAAIDYQGLWKSAALPFLAVSNEELAFPRNPFASLVFPSSIRIKSIAPQSTSPIRTESCL